MLRYVKIKPGVISARCGKKYLTDKTAVYQTNMWPGDDALDLIKRGFLIEVDKDGNDLNAIPVASKIEEVPEGDKAEAIGSKTDDESGKVDSGKKKESNPLEDFLNEGKKNGKK